MKPTLEQQVTWLFDPPPPAVRGGVEAAGELPTPVESTRQVSAWVETRRAGVRLDLDAGRHLRLVAYNPVSGQETVVWEQAIEVLVQEALRQP